MSKETEEYRPVRQPRPIGPNHAVTVLVSVITSIGTALGTVLLTRSNENVAEIQAKGEVEVEAEKAKSAEKITFGTMGHAQLAKEVMPRAQKFIESAATVVGDTQHNFEALLQFSSEGQYDTAATVKELEKLYSLRNSTDSIWSNVVDPGVSEALKQYNNYVAEQLSMLPQQEIAADRRQEIVAESRRLAQTFRTSAELALSRLHGMGLNVGKTATQQ
jgi:hypothetical protein